MSKNKNVDGLELESLDFLNINVKIVNNGFNVKIANKDDKKDFIELKVNVNSVKFLRLISTLGHMEKFEKVGNTDDVNYATLTEKLVSYTLSIFGDDNIDRLTDIFDKQDEDLQVTHLIEIIGYSIYFLEKENNLKDEEDLEKK